MAASSIVAIGVVLAAEYAFGAVIDAGFEGTLIVMLLGAVISMMGAFGISGNVRENLVTFALYPVVTGAGMVLGILVSPHADLLLVVFVGVMFVAVAVRRWGPRFFTYGFMFWMGYFFASFLHATFTTLPLLLAAVVLGTLCVLALSLTVLRRRAHRILAHTVQTFRARARAVARTAAVVLGDVDLVRGRQRLQRQQVRTTETALLIEGLLGEGPELPDGWSPRAVRAWVVGIQVSIGDLAQAASALAAEHAEPEVRQASARMVRALASRDDHAAEQLARALLADPSTGGMAGRHARRIALDVLDLLGRLRGEPGDCGAEAAGEMEPILTLMMGNLPGSGAIVGDLTPPASRWHPARYLDLPLRQAFQVAIAGALAILLGRLLSPERYYWAVIAVFVTFTGTATRTEALFKASLRVIGTVLGLGIAILLAYATAGRSIAVIAVILASVFVGFYLMRVSYAFMIFCITVMVAQLYAVLHEFTPAFLVLRLEETLLGAAIGIAVAFLFIPISTRATARAARRNFFRALATLLETVAGGLAQGRARPGELDARVIALDHRLQQLDLVARPLGRAVSLGGHPAEVRYRLVLFTACAAQARVLAGAVRGDAPGSRAADLTSSAEALRDAAEALAGGDPGGAAAGDALRHLDAAAEALTAHPDSPVEIAEPPERALARLQQILRQLAGPTPTVPAAGTATPTPAPGVSLSHGGAVNTHE